MLALKKAKCLTLCYFCYFSCFILSFPAIIITHSLHFPQFTKDINTETISMKWTRDMRKFSLKSLQYLKLKHCIFQSWILLKKQIKDYTKYIQNIFSTRQFFFLLVASFMFTTDLCTHSNKIVMNKKFKFVTLWHNMPYIEIFMLLFPNVNKFLI